MLPARSKIPIAAFGTVLVLQSAAAAQDFYAGKTVTIFSGHNPGSLYDTNARFVARHLARFVPGNPSVIVRNMPGAGTLTASNHVANLAPKDGTALALVARGVAIEPLLTVRACASSRSSSIGSARPVRKCPSLRCGPTPA